MQIRCPHCHQPIEVLDESSLSALTCPSCVSRFSLVDVDTLAYRPDEHRTIGHFELQENLGAGAFGTVWKAQDTELDRTVAVKFPLQQAVDSQEAEQFFREVREGQHINFEYLD